MRPSLARNEGGLVIKSETVRREAVGCIAWLDRDDLFGITNGYGKVSDF